MSFRIETTPKNTSFVAPGESYLILASTETLRTHLTDSYWCEAMEQVCDGKLQGVAVRYTGDNLVMLQFRPSTLSPSGYRYPLYMSIPVEFMVPVGASGISLITTDVHSNSFTTNINSFASTHSSDETKTTPAENDLPKLCVVCGRYNVPGMLHRSHGWKCKTCKGKKSLEKLRMEARKLQEALKTEAS